MMSEKGCKKDKNQNIQVFVRLRPLNQRERDIKSLGVVEVLNSREVVVRHSPQTTHTKKFTFDHAFGPNAKQVEVYQAVVSPLIEEVLAGYNCTVFAYGQTGTGKTHTMVGENTSEDASWQNDPLAGIIPRALSQLFDELRISNTEYTVRVSYLELYNEELFDLLSSSEDNSKLRIYEDVTRKGSNIVNGLEEITVYNKNEVYKIMSQGQDRKRVASTLMNAQSSRSHTVFTIVVHMKENSPDGEELMKIGKLNLVDLAGSENISKAGSDNPGKKERARECVNINQSLLTLGRVITALVERHPHIPYRESKLTRILQESLGGRTKTSIIATVSPGHKDLEETMSTLEYANRAKNIQNKPEINQKMTKKAILKEYAEEIDRLKRDLQAARDKNGIYLAEETFMDLKYTQEEQRKEIQELLLKMKMMEEKRDTMQTVFSELNKNLEIKASELQNTRDKLSNARTQLANTHNMLHSAKLQYEEQAHLVEILRATEEALSSQAKELVATADMATTHVRCLHDSVDRRRKVESSNLEVTRSYRDQSSEQRAAMMASATDFTRALVEELRKLHADLENVTTSTTSTLEDNKTTLDKLITNISNSMYEIKCLTSASESGLVAATDAHRSTTHTCVENHSGAVRAALAALVRSVAGTVLAAEACHLPENVANFVNQWYCSAVNRVRSVVTSHGTFAARVCESETARGDASRSHYEERRAAIQRRAHKIQDVVTELEAEKVDMQARLARQERDIETERRDSETRLRQWVEEERRVFEQRIQARLESETAVLELRLAKKTEDLETERQYLESRIASHLHSQQTILDAFAQDLVQLDEDSREEQESRAKAENIVHAYSKELNEEAVAIGIDMEAFTQNVVEVVKHMYGELVTRLHRAKEQLENDTKSVEVADAAAGAQLVNETASAHAQLLHQHRDNIAKLLSTVENINASTTTELSSLATSADTLLSSARHHAAGHAACVQDVTSHAAQFARRFRELIERHEHLEGRYLSEQYEVYSPTGSTPQRTQYRYPRSLAATSPHDRILARFRDRMRNNEDECIVIEDVESPAASEGESSLSDDSVSFVAPAPAPAAPRSISSQHNGGIVKCTSESNIYDIKRNEEQQGKENAERDLNGYKKPSKLRAPTSHKKPLYERNDNN